LDRFRQRRPERYAPTWRKISAWFGVVRLIKTQLRTLSLHRDLGGCQLSRLAAIPDWACAASAFEREGEEAFRDEIPIGLTREPIRRLRSMSWGMLMARVEAKTLDMECEAVAAILIAEHGDARALRQAQREQQNARRARSRKRFAFWTTVVRKLGTADRRYNG
jgi:hypothetical protein